MSSDYYYYYWLKSFLLNIKNVFSQKKERLNGNVNFYISVLINSHNLRIDYIHSSRLAAFNKFHWKQLVVIFDGAIIFTNGKIVKYITKHKLHKKNVDILSNPTN